jgi:GxxExxY protein
VLLVESMDLDKEKMNEIGMNQLTDMVIGCAIEVHKQLGPGLLESTYEECLTYELIQKGLFIERQKPLPVIYKDVNLECGYRMDILVDHRLVVEIKAVDSIMPVHEAQVITYLKLSKCKVGLLLNFNVKLMKSGIRRIVNNYEEN